MLSQRMDIARPEFKRQKRKRQIMWGAVGLVCLGAALVAFFLLESAFRDWTGLGVQWKGRRYT